MKKEYPRSFWLRLSIILLLLPALLINLGLLTFIDDEAIRALVALEMKLSGNYIAPTLHGEFYYNKPPLYNWILLLFFNLTGTISEFTARIPTVVCLLGYATTIYYFFRQHFDTKIAFLNALVFVTCGRVLFWDSMLGLIDICFSWVTFTGFMVVFQQFERQKYWALFLLSYLIAAVGFLLKGLPAVVFQGITLFTFFVYQKQFRKLFSIQHITGGFVFLFIVGLYYFLYHQYNSLDHVFEKLFTESSKRTAVNYGLGKTILHFFTFPAEMVYHFLPWSLFVAYLFKKGTLQQIREHRFIAYNALIFLVNLLPYWTSVEVYPRYLLMHAPLVFSVFIYLHIKNEADNTLLFKILMNGLLVICLIISISSFAPLFLKQTQQTPYLYPKTLAWGLGLSVATALFFKWKAERLTVLVLFLVIFRIGFNWFVLPDRNANDFGDLCRTSTRTVGKVFATEKLYLYKETMTFKEKDLPQITNSFYLTNERKQIIRRKSDSFQRDEFYIIDPARYKELKYEQVGTFYLRHGKQTYHIGKLKLEE